MTITIHIEAHPDRGDMRWQVDQAMNALGFYRSAADEVMNRNLVDPGTLSPVGARETELRAAEQVAGEDTSVVSGTSADETDKRLVGAAPEGKARRTKAEIADDDELTALASQIGVSVDGLNSGIAAGGRAAAKAELSAKVAALRSATPGADKPSISTGEERVGPEDDEATQEQDAADEQAEVEANRKADAPLTIDDLKNVMGAYVEKHGIPATQEDGAHIFTDALGKAPGGDVGWKASTVAAAGQETLQKAIAAWKAAGASSERYAPKGA